MEPTTAADFVGRVISRAGPNDLVAGHDLIMRHLSLLPTVAPMTNDYSSLERFAAMRVRPTLSAAQGTCLHATMELAAEALRLGLDRSASVVRWCVCGDPAFLEHWALALESGRVLDTTAVQVDGNPQPLRRLDEYPANYRSPRHYPIEAMSDFIDTCSVTTDHRYPLRQVWKLHCGLFSHDAREAVRSGAPAALLKAFAAILTCSFGLSLAYMTERASARAESLMRRV